LSFLYTTLFAVCSTLFAVCSTLFAVCSTLLVLYLTLLALYSTLSEVYFFLLEIDILFPANAEILYFSDADYFFLLPKNLNVPSVVKK